MTQQDRDDLLLRLSFAVLRIGCFVAVPDSQLKMSLHGSLERLTDAIERITQPEKKEGAQ